MWIAEEERQFQIPVSFKFFLVYVGVKFSLFVFLIPKGGGIINLPF